MDADGFPINCTDTLQLLLEAAATVTPESTQDAINAALADGPYPAFTSVTWGSCLSAPPDVNPKSYSASLPPDARHAATIREQHEALRMATPKQPNAPPPPGLVPDAGHSSPPASTARRSPLCSCCIVGNGYEPLCSGQPQFLRSSSV